MTEEQLQREKRLRQSEMIRRQKLSQSMKRLWNDPVYRKKMIRAQARAGLRTYDTTIYGKPKRRQGQSSTPDNLSTLRTGTRG